MSKNSDKKGVGVSRPKKAGSGSTLQSSPKKAKDLRSDPSRNDWPVHTMEQRLRLYRAMLATVKTADNYAGFCQLLWLKFDLRSPGYLDGLRSLPELYKQNQGRDGTVQSWFKRFCWEPRIKLLKLAIKESAPALGARRARPKGAVPAKQNGAKRTSERTGASRATPNKKK